MRKIFISSGKHQWPFSKGLVVESLLNVGIDQDAATAIARSVEQHIRNKKKRNVTPEELKEMVTEFTRKRLGKKFADQFTHQIPTFTDINVQDDSGLKLPFSRGILARSLEVARLTPRQAYETAKEVDRRLRMKGVEEITSAEIETLTEEVLEETVGAAGRSAYRDRYHSTGALMVQDPSGLMYPFSKGILAQSLLATGLTSLVAHRISRDTELQLRELRLKSVTRAQIRHEVEQALIREVGEDIALRYRLMRVIRNPERPLVIMVGGVSGTGKSYIAAEIAYRLGITRVVSTDSIREVMRAMISPQLTPTLHASTFEAWQSLLGPDDDRELPTEEQLLQGFREQVQQVSLGIHAIIQRAIKENTSIVLEGVHIVPGYFGMIQEPGALFIPMLMALPDEETHRSRFYSRDQETHQLRPKQRYLNHFMEIRALQDYIMGLAEKTGVPALQSDGQDRNVEQAMEVIANRVLQSVPIGMPERR